MMRVTITNNATAPIDVPVAALVANAQPPHLAIAGGESGDIVYLTPPANETVAAALRTWAQGAGADIALAFAPHTPTPVVPEPAPAPPPPRDPLGLT